MIVGLAAKARSGKDRLADEIVRISDFEKYSLADPIKACVNEMFGFDERHSEGFLKEIELPVLTIGINHMTAVIYKHFSDQLSYFVCQQLAEVFKVLLAKRRVLNTSNNVDYWIVSPRQLYQWFGTDVMRKEYSDTFWIDVVDTDRNLIIADIRFENEAEWIRENGHLIHITREDAEQVNSHESEKGVDIKEDDSIIANNGSLDSFLMQAKDIVKYLNNL